jgi:hypothetical protein
MHHEVLCSSTSSSTLSTRSHFLAARRRREVGTAATVLGTGIAICAMRVGVAGLTALPEASDGQTQRR